MSDFMLYTEWVDDNGAFKTGQNLLKPLDINFMYAKGLVVYSETR